MKIQLIMLPNQPVLVSDEEIKVGDFFYDLLRHTIINVSSLGLMISIGSFSRKIIGGIPELPQIDFSALSEEDCKKIGWVDVERLAEIRFTGSADVNYNLRFGFQEGFKTAQSLNENKFSLEDLRHAFNEGLLVPTTKIDFIEDTFNKVIQSLSQPKVFDVLIEMVEHKEKESGNLFYLPAIINNSIKILKVL